MLIIRICEGQSKQKFELRFQDKATVQSVNPMTKAD
jgi:hypothetical protein